MWPFANILRALVNFIKLHIGLWYKCKKLSFYNKV